MALARRAFDWEIQQALLVCNDPDWSTSINLLDIFKEIEITITADTMEAEAAMDPSDSVSIWRHPRIRSRDWNVRASAVMDNEAASEESENLFSLGHMATDGTITFTLLGPASMDDVSKNVRITGVMTVGDGRYQLGGEAAEQELNLVSYSPPTVAID